MEIKTEKYSECVDEQTMFCISWNPCQPAVCDTVDRSVRQPKDIYIQRTSRKNDSEGGIKSGENNV